MKRRYAFYPFLFALYPVVSLLERNQTEIVAAVAVRPAIVILAFSAALYTLFAIVFKNITKAGIYLSLLAVLFFSYGPVQSLLPKNAGILSHFVQIGANKLLFASCLLMLSITFYLLKKSTNSLDKIAQTLTIIAIGLIGLPLSKIVRYQLLAGKLLPDTTSRLRLTTPIKKTAVAPDIYYLIFDRYAANQTLKDELQFDNSKLTNYLKKKGFYIAEESLANYPKTFESLASSLNFKHLTYLTAELGENSSTQTPVNRLLDKHRVGKLLQQQGYTYYHLGSWWHATAQNSLADKVYSWNYLGLDEFSKILLESTAAFPIIKKLQAAEFGDENPLRVEQKLRIPYKMHALLAISRKKGPKFVFAHILLPHGPYVFNAAGKTLSETEVAKNKDSKNYLEQLKFANTKIKALVDGILTNSSQAPIIIIQSDEGPCFDKEFALDKGWGNCGENIDWRKLSDHALKFKMRIFNAYYLPGLQAEKVLYPNITPVNTFRVIFNEYFGANYQLLPDTSYVFTDLKHPYKFVEVTSRVKY